MGVRAPAIFCKTFVVTPGHTRAVGPEWPGNTEMRQRANHHRRPFCRNEGCTCLFRGLPFSCRFYDVVQCFLLPQFVPFFLACLSDCLLCALPYSSRVPTLSVSRLFQVSNLYSSFWIKHDSVRFGLLTYHASLASLTESPRMLSQRAK